MDLSIGVVNKLVPTEGVTGCHHPIGMLICAMVRDAVGPEIPPDRAGSASDCTPSSAPEPGITARAALLGFLLMPVNAFWITIVEVRWYTLDGTCLPLFITPIFFLFTLCIGNAIVGRWRHIRPFSQGELLTVYVMLVISCVLAGHDLIQNLFGIIAHADRYNTPERKYDSTFFQYLKPTSFLLVQDSDPGGKDAIKAFYQGGVRWYEPKYLYPFLGPLIWWTLFLSVLIGMCLCISVLIRRAWTENEKLAFPIVQLPLAMTHDRGRSAAFWRSRVMWSGFAVSATIDFVNGMHYLYPSWPYLAQVKLFDLAPYLTQRPWNAVGWTPISLYPFAIGLAFFLPLDLAFSCWFFYVARKGFQILGASQGWDSPSNLGFPFFEQQSSGAWIALASVVLWSLRSQFRLTWNRCSWGRRSGHGGDDTATERGEIRQYRAAYLGLGAGSLFLVWFSWQTGLSSWVALIFFGLFFMLAVAMTRVRAELGAPHEIFFVNPRTVLVTLFGINTVGAQSLTTTSVLYWYNRCYRCHPMPNHIEAFKLADNGRMQIGRLIALIAFATVAAIIFACIANLHVTYAEGATSKAVGYKSWVGFESYDRLNAWLQTPTKPLWSQRAYVIAGAVIVLGLRMMRGAFLWWPFHPAGYALAVSFAMDYFWFAFFVSWLIKLVVIRFGGMRLHNAAVPFFLGLTLGDYVCGSLWAIYGPANGLQVYKIFI